MQKVLISCDFKLGSKKLLNEKAGSDGVENLEEANNRRDRGSRSKEEEFGEKIEVSEAGHQVLDAGAHEKESLKNR